MWEAERILGKRLVKILPDHRFYSSVSERLMDYLREQIGSVEQFSIDELFSDLTGMTDDYETFAEELKHGIYRDI
jgi:nucleotidyltransferase/DNA polymerase involved in DNA repair